MLRIEGRLCATIYNVVVRNDRRNNLNFTINYIVKVIRPNVTIQ